jgi:hypothetical protein
VFYLLLSFKDARNHKPEIYVLHWVIHSGCTVWGVGLRPLTYWDCGFEFRQGYRSLSLSLSLVSVVCCQVKVCVSGWSLVQRIRTECSVSNWVWSWEWGGRTWPTRGLSCPGKKNVLHSIQSHHSCSSDTGVWTWLGVLMVQPGSLWDSVAVALFSMYEYPDHSLIQVTTT